MSTDEAAKKQIFISHIHDERDVAILLKEYLEKAFSPNVSIFVSSDDKRSVGTREWFEDIKSNLDKADVLVVLYSVVSVHRSWISYEVGWAAGKKVDIIPVLVKEFSPGRLSLPLSAYLARPSDNLPVIIADISKSLDLVSNRHSVYPDEYVAAIREVESKLAYIQLRVSCFVLSGYLHFEIKNEGNTDLELLMLEAYIPKVATISQRGGPVLDGRIAHYTTIKRDGVDYLYMRLTSNRGAYGWVKPVLPPVLTPSMPPLVPEAGVLCSASAEDSEMPPILWQVHVSDHSTTLQSIEWKQVESR